MEDKKQIWREADIYVAACMYLFCAVLVWQILSIKIAESRMLPTVALVIAFVSATAVLVSAVKKNGAARDIRTAGIKRRELVVLVMLVIAGWLCEVLGFYSTVAVFALGVLLVLEAPLNGRKVLTSLCYVAVMIGLMYVCFAVLLGMVTPEGLFI